MLDIQDFQLVFAAHKVTCF